MLPELQELLALSVVAVLCLLVVYHRYYDAVLLAVPITWSFTALHGAHWREGVAVLLLSADFILPFQTALHAMQQEQLLPAWLTGGPLWGVLITQHVWALVLMTLVLLLAAAREPAESAATSPACRGRC